jgi:hypothetical protein
MKGPLPALHRVAAVKSTFSIQVGHGFAIF